MDESHFAVISGFLDLVGRAESRLADIKSKLVRSGLDDTMCKAYREIHEVLHTRENVPDLRTAAFVVAIQKIARTYMEMGL